MNRKKNIKTKVILFILVPFIMVSCHNNSLSILENNLKEEVEIVSFSKGEGEVVIFSSQSMNLDNYIIRQGESKSFYSLSGIEIEKENSLEIKLPSSFLRKGKNEIVLYKLEKVSSWEEN